MNQVSSNLEFSWTFKNGFQNSKSLLCRSTDIDMLAFHVLQISLSNLSWSFCESRSLRDGEEHTRRWALVAFLFDHRFRIVYGSCRYVDDAILAFDYPLIYCPNDCGHLTKVVEQLVGCNFAFWPKVQIGPCLAQIGTPPCSLQCSPRVRRLANVVTVHARRAPALSALCCRESRPS
jgi:hypothetical protein